MSWGKKQKELKEILIEELENKKIFNANRDTYCDVNGEDILQDDEFVFMGNKQKMCRQCLDDLQELVEERL